MSPFDPIVQKLRHAKSTRFSASLSLLLLIFFAIVGCSDSSGGGQRTGTQKPASGELTTRDQLGDPTPDSSEYDESNDTDNSNINGEETDSPDDTFVCKFMAAQSATATRVAKELNYLCKQGGLEKLRKSQLGKMLTVDDRQSGGLSYFTFAGARHFSGSVRAARDLGDTFCESFTKYKQLVGADAFKEIESITPSNASDNGCDYDFKGKKILFFQPSFRARQKFHLTPQQTVAMWASYLTQRGSLVEDSKTLNVLVRDDDKIWLYSVQTSVSETKGFHSQTRTGLIAGNEAGMNGFAAAISKLE